MSDKAILSINKHHRWVWFVVAALLITACSSHDTTYVQTTINDIPLYANSDNVRQTSIPLFDFDAAYNDQDAMYDKQAPVVEFTSHDSERVILEFYHQYWELEGWTCHWNNYSAMALECVKVQKYKMFESYIEKLTFHANEQQQQTQITLDLERSLSLE